MNCWLFPKAFHKYHQDLVGMSNELCQGDAAHHPTFSHFSTHLTSSIHFYDKCHCYPHSAWVSTLKVSSPKICGNVYSYLSSVLCSTLKVVAPSPLTISFLRLGIYSAVLPNLEGCTVLINCAGTFSPFVCNYIADRPLT